MQYELPLHERPRTRSNPPRALVVLSGGQDSTTCLFHAKHVGFEVHTVTFDYGQHHRREIEAAAIVAKMAGSHSHEVVRLGTILKGTSPLLNGGRGLEQYEHHSTLPGGLEKTFVPMRNQLFLTVAANRAYVLGAEALVTGVSAEDNGGYPDCRAAFIKAIGHATNLGTFTGEDGAPKSLATLTPLMHESKASTVMMAVVTPGCYAALSFTHTGYDGAYPPLGRDHATLLRAKGFEEANIPDPLILRAHFEGLMDLPDTPNYSPRMVGYVLTRFNLLNVWGLE